MRLKTIYKKFRTQILIVITIVLVEKIAWIIEPSIFGRVIDGMIVSARNSHLVMVYEPLCLWMFIFAINSAAGAIARSFGERTYLNIFTEIATGLTVHDTENGNSHSRTAARAELAREYITFLQYRVPEIIEQVIDIGGAVIALAFFDHRISLACMSLIIPFFVATRIYNKNVVSMESELHSNREEVFENFSDGDPQRVRKYYNRIAVIQSRIANWGAFNFAFFRMFLLCIFLVVLYISIDLDDFSTGQIYSIVAYLWTFVTSAEYLPDLLESWSSLKDLSVRFQKTAA